MKITTITKRDVIRDVRQRWMSQYAHYDNDYQVAWGSQKPAGQIRKELQALDLETCTQADVDSAIDAGSSWAANECDVCDKDVDLVVRVGEDPDYGARWVDMCEDCAGFALKAFSRAE